ncbi:DUF3169 family protein [Solibacillus sp. A46]|uniref:DUF3169 family protein n=1 Tax=Solibacillus faecavium TaxID=2762221 RepID=A0ABR8Y014_9BACL|nr:DUF3169 family protein [Solibacillus faecavium]MBD8037546.1 DUF3169 family protein [Solibacillus faecavium]
MKKTLIQLLGGAAIGAPIGFFTVSGNFALPIYEIATEMTLVFLGIAFLLLVGSLLKLAQLKQKSAQQFSGDEEDLHEQYLYTLYSDVSLASNIALILSIVAMCIGVITEQSIVILILSIFVVLLSILSTILVGTSLKYAYPNREFPSFNDNQYSKKLLEMSDEGERHVMLQGFYSAFNTANILLLASLLLLMFYSIASGESQLFAILIISLILIIVNTQYMLKVRNR